MTPAARFPLFTPNPARAAVIERRVRLALADSLATVFAACEGHLSWPPEGQHALLAALRSHAVPPAVFGLYAEWVEALLAEDQAAAQARLEALLRPQRAGWASPRVVTLDEASLSPGLPALYARVLDDDPDMPLRIGPVDAAELARGRALHEAAAALIQAAAPDLLHEIETVAPEIVLVQDTGPGEAPGAFDGASSFYLWGAMILNSARQRTRPQLATALAHEAAHATLLGSTLGAPLVSNDAAARYRSPLRQDPRPMDGLVHASFVLARMLWCQDRLLQSGLLAPEEADETRRARSANRDRFARSETLIAAEARFTPEGEALWTDARRWVHQAG